MADERVSPNIDFGPEEYRLLQVLVPEQTFLCCDASGNVVVLKRLEEDCLHRRQLHPNIRDRLARVRELAHPQIATLRTVERWQEMPCLVWIYLDGEIWDEAAMLSVHKLLQQASALAATVGALHETGVVHGSLHGRNIIVRPNGQVWLTHFSPYLYTDIQADIFAVIDLLRIAIGAVPLAMKTRLEHLLDELQSGQLSLREFSHAMLTFEDESEKIQMPQIETAINYRWSSLLMAMVVAAFGIGLWTTIRATISKHEVVMPATFPSLQRNIRLQP